MILKSDVKFARELTGRFKIDTRNLTNFHHNGLFLTKVYNVWAKKSSYRGVMFDRTDDLCKISRKTDLCFQKWHEELANVHKLKNSDFNLESKMVKLN